MAAISTFKKWVCVADSHGDRMDAQAGAYALQFIKDYKPHSVFHLGDFMDLRPFRKGCDKDEKMEHMGQDVTLGLEFLSELKPKYMPLGNHDERLWEVAERGEKGGAESELARMLLEKVEARLKKLKVTYTRYDVRENVIQPAMGGPKLIHGFKSSMYPAKAHAAAYGACLSGHVHAYDVHYLEHVDDIVSVSAPALMELKQGYNKKFIRRLKHTQGFLAGVTCSKTGRWMHWPVLKLEDGTWIDPKDL